MNSGLRDKYKWILIDSTGKVPIRPLPSRMFHAIKRLIIFIWHLLFSRIDTALLFTGDGTSFLEKGVMTIMTKWRGKTAIIAPRSGFILRDLDNSKQRKFIKYVFQKADIVICQSLYWKEVFEQVYPDGNYRVVHNWIDTEKYIITTSKIESATVKLLFLGWIVAEKGVYELIDAIAALHQKGYNIELNLGGNGDAFEAVAQRIKQYHLEEVVQLKGWVKGAQKSNLLANTDIFVLPTHFEGFPNALVEAMASGLPIVASDIEPIQAIVKHGKHALLFQCGSKEDLEAKIEQLIQDVNLRKRLAANAQHLVQQEMTIENGVLQFDRLLQTV